MSENNMADAEDEKVQSKLDSKQDNVLGESGSPAKTVEKERVPPPKTQEDFRQVGRDYIESIKASLLASSASFNRALYAATLEDPYMKAYRYLEENKVPALLEDLITYTAFERPSEPFPFMIKVVQEFYTNSEQKVASESEKISF